MRRVAKPKRDGKPQPTLGAPTANQIGKRGEKNTCKALDARLTPASGAGRIKGDLEHGGRMVEKKSTAGKSMKLERHWLEKLEKEAFDAGKEPVLVIEFETMSFGSSQWALVPLDKFKEFCELEDGEEVRG